MFREFVAAKRRAIRDHDRDMHRAWNTAALHAAASVGKLPPLRRLLIVKPPIRKPSIQEQRGVMEILSAQLGIPLRQAVKRPKKKDVA